MEDLYSPCDFQLSRAFSEIMEAVPRGLITVGITTTLMFHIFLSSLAKSQYLFCFSLSLIFLCHHLGQPMPLFGKITLFLLPISRSGLLILFVSQNLCGFYASHLPGRILDCAYTIFTVWSNFSFLHNFQWITFATLHLAGQVVFLHFWPLC